MRRLVALALLPTTLAGCGGGLTLPAVPRVAEGFRGLADFPAIDRQIQDLAIGLDAIGTRMRRMPDPGKAKPVTFLTYKALDNNLGGTRPDHLNVLERSGSNGGINVLAMTDEAGPDNTYAYYVRQDRDEHKVTSPYMPIWPGERDTGSPYTLAQAVRWGFTSYPAKLRWLDVNDHGHGAYGIAEDEHNGSRLELPALEAAMYVGNQDQPLDVVSFDACLMATAEVAYELREAARFMVASEDVSYALGMNYDKTIKSLEGKPADGATLARALVLRAERRGASRAIYSLSAVDLSKAARLAQAVDQLAGALLAVLPTQKAAVVRAITQTPRFFVASDGEGGTSDEHHRDLAALAASFKATLPDPRVRQAADGVVEALFGKQKAVMLAVSADEQKGAAQGLSIMVRTDGVVEPIYRRTALARDTRWDELLLALRP